MNLSDLFAPAPSVVTVYQHTITTSGTWNKDAAIQDNDDVYIYVVAGGGGGYTSKGGWPGNGGDGGLFLCKGRDLPASVAAVIGAGGAVASDGGDTSFGSIVVKGGQAGESSNTPSNGTVAPDDLERWSMGGRATGSAGGPSIFGGGAGTKGAGPGGVSMIAGDGGNNSANNAQIPGGGGSVTQPGARGEIRIVVTRG